MGYGTPEKSYEYGSEEDPVAERRETLRKRQIQYEPYSPQQKKTRLSERALRGAKQAVSTGYRSIRGFASDVKKEGIKSSYKTERTLKRVNPIRRERELRRYARRTPRVRIIQRREVTPASPSLGERIVGEMSYGYTPVLDRQFFSTEEKDFFGEGIKEQELVSNPLKKNQRLI